MLDECLLEVNGYCQGIAWALKSCYFTEAKWLTVFLELRTGMQKEACIFKQGILPLTFAVIGSVAQFFYDNYIDQDEIVFRKLLYRAVDGGLEHRKLTQFLAVYYRY